jgi:hypothetical protein
MWQRGCFPPKTPIQPHRLHRIRGRYAALSTSVRCAYIQRRTRIGEVLFPFSKYASVTTRFPGHKPATIKQTHYPSTPPAEGICLAPPTRLDQQRSFVRDARGQRSTSVRGQTEKSGRAIGKSALPSGTDIVSLASQVRKVPRGDLSRCSNVREQSCGYSITSSARASRLGATSRPSDLAVLRLITSLYLVGCCTGRSAGFSPLRMRST